jgi:hypothetical protein
MCYVYGLVGMGLGLLVGLAVGMRYRKKLRKLEEQVVRLASLPDEKLEEFREKWKNRLKKG